MVVCELTVGSPEWERVSAARDPARVLQELIAGGKVSPTDQPHIVTQTNRQAVTSLTTRIPYVIWDPQKKDFVQQQVEVGDRIAVTPRILTAGQVSLAVEVNIGQLADWVQGPDGSRVPIVTSQSLNSNLSTRDKQPVIIAGLVRLYRSKGENDARKTESRDVMILITPTIHVVEGWTPG
jgi:type II secretory pathway component HofQ